MGGVREMFGGMAIGRTVATANMTTGQAETKMHPRRSHLQAFFTACRVSRHRLKIAHVWTAHGSPLRMTQDLWQHNRNPRVGESPQR